MRHTVFPMTSKKSYDKWQAIKVHLYSIDGQTLYWKPCFVNLIGHWNFISYYSNRESHLVLWRQGIRRGSLVCSFPSSADQNVAHRQVKPHEDRREVFSECIPACLQLYMFTTTENFLYLTENNIGMKFSRECFELWWLCFKDEIY